MNTVVSLNDASGGMVGDDRSVTTNVASLIKNVDPISRKHRVTPYFDVQNGDASSATNLITDFLNYGASSLATTLFGLGQASSNVQVFNKNALASGNAWSTFANSTGGAGGVPQPGVFAVYHGSAYGGHVADGTIWRCQLNGAGFTNADTTLGAAPTAQAIVHSKDDCLYMGANNVLARNNVGSWTTAALTLPTGTVISCLSEFNDFLAIGCNLPSGKSIVYLWDRNSSLTTTSANLDWGFGSLQTLQQVEEYLVGVSTTSSAGLYPKMVFRRYISGAGGQVFNELFASSATGLQVVGNSMKVGNRMYFMGGITIDGTLHNGIFAIQRPTLTGDFSVWIDRLPNNDTGTSSAMGGFTIVNDYVYLSYASGTTMRYTNSGTTAYSATSYWETVWNPSMQEKDKTKNKTLKVIALTTLPISANGGNIAVDYKVDGGNWITVYTQTTVGSVTTELTKDATGTSFTSGREYKFRVKPGGASSVGLVEVTEFKYSYEILDSLI